MKRLFLLLITLFLLFTFACNKNTGNTPIDLETINNEETQVLDNNQNKTEKNVKTETELTEKTEPVEKTETEVIPIVPTETIVEETKYNITIRSFNNELILQTTNSLTQEIIDESGYNDVIYLDNLYYDEMFTNIYDGLEFTSDSTLYLKIDNIYDYKYFIDNNYFYDFTCFSVMNSSDLLSSVLLSDEDKEDFKETFSDYFNTLKDVFVVYVAMIPREQVVESSPKERVIIKNIYLNEVLVYRNNNYYCINNLFPASMEKLYGITFKDEYGAGWSIANLIKLYNTENIYEYNANDFLIEGINFYCKGSELIYTIVYNNDVYTIEDKSLNVNLDNQLTIDNILELYQEINESNFDMFYMYKVGQSSAHLRYSVYEPNNYNDFYNAIYDYLKNYKFVNIMDYINYSYLEYLKSYDVPIALNSNDRFPYYLDYYSNESNIKIRFEFQRNYSVLIKVYKVDNDSLVLINCFTGLSQMNQSALYEIRDEYCVNVPYNR